MDRPKLNPGPLSSIIQPQGANTPPEKVLISESGFVEAAVSKHSIKEVTYKEAVEAATEKYKNYLLADPKTDTDQRHREFYECSSQLAQLALLRLGHQPGQPRLTNATCTAKVPAAAKAILENRDELQNRVATAFDGIDVAQMEQEAKQINHVRQVKSTFTPLIEGLDDMDAGLAQHLSGTIRTINDRSEAAIEHVRPLRQKMEPVRDLIHSSAEQAAETARERAKLIAETEERVRTQMLADLRSGKLVIDDKKDGAARPTGSKDSGPGPGLTPNKP